jgi:hypothetical protein
MHGPNPLMQSSQISLGVIRFRDPAPPFEIVKKYAAIGTPQHGEIEIDASVVGGKLLRSIDAFRGQAPAVVTRLERPALFSRRQEIVLEVVWPWPT